MTTRPSATAVPGRPDADRDPQLGPLLDREHRRQAVVVRPVQVAGGRVEQVEDDAVGTDQATGLGHDVAQDLARLAQDGDPGGDLAEGLLRVRPPREGYARLPEGLDQARRPDGDRRLVRDGAEQSGIVRRSTRPAGRSTRAMRRTARLVDERDGHHGHDSSRPEIVIDGPQVREPRVREVVARPERPAIDDRLPGHALVERLGLAIVRLEGLRGAQRPCGVGATKLADGRVDQVDPSTVGVHQPGRLLDGQLEDRRQVGRGTDPGGDLAQRAFDVGPSGEFPARRVEGPDQPGVGHRRRRVVGQGPDEPDVGLAEGIEPGRERAERAEDLVARDQRRHDHRPDPDVADDPVRVVGVVERLVGQVVARQDHRSPLDREPEHPRPDGQVDRADPFATALAPDAGVVGEAKVPGRRIDEVDDRAVGIEKARRLVDGGDQELVDVACTAVRVATGAAPGATRRRGGRGLARMVVLVVGLRGGGRVGGWSPSARGPCRRRHGPSIRRDRERRHRRSPMATTSSGRGDHRRPAGCHDDERHGHERAFAHRGRRRRGPTMRPTPATPTGTTVK